MTPSTVETADQPFGTDVHVRDRTDDLTRRLSAGELRRAAADNGVSFDVTFVAPNGILGDHERIQAVDRGAWTSATPGVR